MADIELEQLKQLLFFGIRPPSAPPTKEQYETATDNDPTEAGISISERLRRERLTIDRTQNLCKSCAVLIHDMIRRDAYHCMNEGDHQVHDIIHSAQHGCRVCFLFQSVFEVSGPCVSASSSRDTSSTGKRTAKFDVSVNDETRYFQLFLPFESHDVPPIPLPEAVFGCGSDPAVLRLARSWMNTCHESHYHCDEYRTSLGDVYQMPLPTRVLQVPLTGNADPRLYVSRKGDRGRYATLSHCWGEIDPVKLTADNLEEFQRGIPLSKMPKTFRHAILVVRALGIEFLWIDCFGIMQDSRDDWLKESGNMTHIYSNSAVSLCAASANDCEQGLLLPRTLKAVEVDVQFLGRVGVRQFVPKLDHMLRHAPTEERAWILQETTLAPAVLYFGTDSLYWQCCQLTASESFPDGRSITIDPSPERPFHTRFEGDLRLEWFSIVKKYTARKLRRESDRLIAIQGLARKLETKVGAQYNYGLWMSDLHRGLLWHRAGLPIPGLTYNLDRTPNFLLMFDQYTEQPLFKQVVYGSPDPTDPNNLENIIACSAKIGDKIAPSWSWGSLNSAVSYDWLLRHLPFKDPVEFGHGVEFFSDSDSHPEHLCLAGYLIEGCCAPKPYRSGRALAVVFNATVLSATEGPQLGCVIDLDADYVTDDCFMLPISAWQIKNDGVWTKMVFYLILVKVKTSGAQSERQSTAYRRIGMGGVNIEKMAEVIHSARPERQRVVLV